MLVLALVTSISIYDPGFREVLTKMQAAPPGSKVLLQLRSGGGSIDDAIDLGKAMVERDVTCHVAEAQSAALQLVLPACKRLVVRPDARIGWHAAAGCRPGGWLDGKEAFEWVRESIRASGLMAGIMRNYLGKLPADSCPAARKETPELGQSACELMHMFAETVWTGQQFADAYAPVLGARVRVAPVKVPASPPPGTPSPTVEGDDPCK